MITVNAKPADNAYTVEIERAVNAMVHAPGDKYVYVDFYPDTWVPFYVGMGIASRCDDPERSPFHTNVVNKILRDGKDFTRFVITGPVSHDLASSIEKVLVETWGRRYIDPNGILVNRVQGGEPYPVYTLSQESELRREKIRAAAVRMWEQPSHRDKMSQIHKDLWKDPAHRAKVLESRAAHRLAPGFKEMMSNAGKQRYIDHPDSSNAGRVWVTRNCDSVTFLVRREDAEALLANGHTLGRHDPTRAEKTRKSRKEFAQDPIRSLVWRSSLESYHFNISEDEKRRTSQKAAEYNRSPEGRARSAKAMQGKRCIHNGIECRRVLPDELNHYLTNGWKLGLLRKSASTKKVHPTQHQDGSVSGSSSN